MEDTLDFNEITGSNSDSRSVADVLANGYSFSIGDAFSLGFDIFKQNAWSFAGYTLLQFIILLVIFIIPFLGFLINIIMMIPTLQAGPYFVAHKIQNKEWYEFGNFFDGFKGKLGNLVLNQLIFIGLTILLSIPLGGIVFASLGVGFFSDPSFFLSNTFYLISCFLTLLFVFIFSLFAFNVPLILFKDSGPWDSIVNSAKITLKNYFPILGLLIILYILNVIGSLLFLIGLLFTIPLSICIIYASFHLIFSNHRRQNLSF